MIRLAPLLLLIVAGCAVALAEDADGGADLLVLTSGEHLEGQIVDVRDGKYWMVLEDGRTVGVDFRTVRRVDMGDDHVEPVPASQLPLPVWPNREDAEGRRRIAAGFDFGLTQGARVRIHFDSRGVSHLDTTLGLRPVLASGLGVALLTGVEGAFPRDSPVRVTLGTSLGATLIYGSLYPFIGGGVGLQVDPRGPFELHVGAQAGTNFSSLAVVPELHTSWVW